MAEEVSVATGTVAVGTGTAGLQTQAGGAPATVSSAAEATGGIDGGNFVEVDIDDELFKFNSDDTPLMNLMLKAKKVKIDSPEVDHFMIDEPRSSVTTSAKLEATTGNTGILQLNAEDQNIPRPYGTLLVEGVDGYAEDGKTKTVGKPLQLFVVGHDQASGNPIVRAVNGPKTPTSIVRYPKSQQAPYVPSFLTLSMRHRKK